MGLVGLRLVLGTSGLCCGLRLGMHRMNLEDIRNIIGIVLPGNLPRLALLYASKRYSSRSVLNRSRIDGGWSIVVV